MKTYDEIKFLKHSHLHFQVLDSFQLLSFFLDREVLEVTNNTFDELYNLICECSRVQAVLRRHRDLVKFFLQV